MVNKTGTKENEEAVTALTNTNLTEYMARAWLTLWCDRRPMRVLQLARKSGVPRNKLYDVLTRLHENVLIETTSAEPLEVQALPLDAWLNRVRHDLNAAEVLIKNLRWNE